MQKGFETMPERFVREVPKPPIETTHSWFNMPLYKSYLTILWPRFY